MRHIRCIAHLVKSSRMRASFLALLMGTPLLAQPSLLAELQTFGNCHDWLPTTTTFEILLGISGAPAPIGERAEWSITATLVKSAGSGLFQGRANG
jgi:hypothetical protein